MNPLSIYAAIAMIAAALSGFGAWNVQTWRYAAKDAQRIEAQAELARNDRKAAQVASEGFENDRTKTEIRYRTITKQVEKIIVQPAYLRECLPPDGLRALRDAIGSAIDPSQSANTLPESR